MITIVLVIIAFFLGAWIGPAVLAAMTFAWWIVLVLVVLILWFAVILSDMGPNF